MVIRSVRSRGIWDQALDDGAGRWPATGRRGTSGWRCRRRYAVRAAGGGAAGKGTGHSCDGARRAVGWTGPITWFRDNVRRLRPPHAMDDPYDRLTWLVGDAARRDLWFPLRRIPLQDRLTQALDEGRYQPHGRPGGLWRRRARVRVVRYATGQGRRRGGCRRVYEHVELWMVCQEFPRSLLLLAGSVRSITRVWMPLGKALSSELWRAEIRTDQGRAPPVNEKPRLRAREVYVHAVGVATGCGFGDLPGDFLVPLSDASWPSAPQSPWLGSGCTPPTPGTRGSSAGRRRAGRGRGWWRQCRLPVRSPCPLSRPAGAPTTHPLALAQ